MRAFLVMMSLLCLAAGSYLLFQAPSFFLPDRWDPRQGRLIDPLSARLLGAGLLALALAGTGLLRRRFYGGDSDGNWPARHFLLLVLAMLLIGGAMNRAAPQPNPDYRATPAPP